MIVKKPVPSMGGSFAVVSRCAKRTPLAPHITLAIESYGSPSSSASATPRSWK